MISLVGDQFKEDIRGCYNKNILHGYAGAVIAQKELNIQDDQILSAIRYHTTGKKYRMILKSCILIRCY